MKRICVVGAGHVGLVTAACLADMGYRVACVDVDKAKVAYIQAGRVPIYEPDLGPMVTRNLNAGRLFATTSLEEGLKDADFAFMCVGTPATADGGADLTDLRKACSRTVAALPRARSIIVNNVKVSKASSRVRPIIVNKSTVPPGTTDMMESLFRQSFNGKGAPAVVANPEFLREGHAVFDFLHPDRVVIGTSDPWAASAVARLYRPLGRPVLVTSARTAEMIKYASNAFLATKVSFINEIACMCEGLGVDVDEVAAGIGLDHRIGGHFLKAGIGYGGSCLPKDVSMLASLAAGLGYRPRLLNAVMETNAQQPLRLVQRLKAALRTLEGTRVAVLGLAFKPDTDDTRFSQAIEVVRALLSEGAKVAVCDPQARLDMEGLRGRVEWVVDPYEAARGCDALVLATDWPEFLRLDLSRLKSVMRGNIVVDGRNALNQHQVWRAGLFYIGVGKGMLTPAPPSYQFHMEGRLLSPVEDEENIPSAAGGT